MGISYKPLFKLLVDREMTKTDLRKKLGLSSATLAKLGKGEPLSGESIERLCIYFHCQPGELVEYIWTPDDDKVSLPNPKKRTARQSTIQNSGTKRKI